jgi:ribosomal protein S18 acetylase RimI-like enzyme
VELYLGQLVDRHDRQVATLPSRPRGDLTVRTASVDDVDDVLGLLAEASEWMSARGFANWPPRFSERFITSSATKGELFVAELEGGVGATLTLQRSDPRFWGDDSVATGGAGYVHRLAVRRSFAGRGIGYRLLEWAAERVRASGGEWLRLDVVTDNAPLRRYYEAAGFVHCRDIEGEFVLPDGTPRAWRTSLYERSVR